MSRTNLTRTLAAGLVAGIAATPSLAQDPPDLDWHTMDSGGIVTVSYQGLSLSGTIGQVDVGGLVGDDLTITGGFWAHLPDSGYCLADWDSNGAIEPADVAAYINTWFNDLVSATTYADLDGSAAIEPADVALFINLWMQALTSGC